LYAPFFAVVPESWTKLQWLQNPGQTNVDDMSNVRVKPEEFPGEKKGNF
jgi:hypothetical protein